MRHVTLALSLALMIACSGEPAVKTTAPENMEPLTIRATGDIKTPVKMIDAGFVPNSVASWASQIILLSDQGDIWRTNADGERPLLISKGDYTDVRGLSRPETSGIFFAALPDGRASAFVERDDIGNFKPLTVSQGAFGIRTFCTGSGSDIWFIDLEGTIRQLTQSSPTDMTVELSASDPTSPPPNTPLSCAVTPAGDIIAVTQKDEKLTTVIKSGWDWTAYTGDITSPSLTSLNVSDNTIMLGRAPGSTALTLLSDGVAYNLVIEDGLSIRGITDTSFVTGTDAAMGSAYNDGLVLIGDANEDRLVLLSLDYTGRVLGLTPVSAQ